ncbi:FAD/NAD(P)-binding domain superfamily [Arabidopsis thaliana x Arabidopsis arenosa]|uniref:FAD/NAD(P)-binding domain superfamily n=1 Tax=Arabidopsis thaliana x Arabidopsis arenosa TaxID=1240361 RepID=A0A8T2DZ33_9BRAS|nr:FAD/NAD(P)-binding domain superfamily [Arabidopsis thaliana x Arabidopsis arenosa]
MSLSQTNFLSSSLLSSSHDLRIPYSRAVLSYPRIQTHRILCATKRTGKRRYPSERRKLRTEQKEAVAKVKNKLEGVWRLSKLGVPVGDDPGKDFLGISEGLLQAIAKVIEFPVASMLPEDAFSVIRKSFDARKILKEAKFVYTVDLDVKTLLELEPRAHDFIFRLEPKIGLIEHVPTEKSVSGDLISVVNDCKRINSETASGEYEPQIINGSGDPHHHGGGRSKPKIAVVGGGPSGLFAALVLAEFGADVTLIERGQAVEERGRDIGALVVRKILDMESNFCFGEGGAGTWSDGKLVTRIGKNSATVLAVLKTLVRFGAPENILINGKPHLGTDKLVPLLRNFRHYLQSAGVTIKFGTRVDDLLVEDSRVVGVRVSDSTNQLQTTSQNLKVDAVVLAVGHSARDTYEMLHSRNVELIPKDFAVGLRIEHPQELINSIQYSDLANEVLKGRGKVPVADYKVVQYVNDKTEDLSQSSSKRSCYSFCMCPGGQVVLTSTNPTELCINGMSFSRRSSKWANAALVVTVSAKDFDVLNLKGPLAGIEFQREFERRAAIMGGGDFTVPVQRVTDFLQNKLSETPLPPSSYRLGVKSANLHELFPAHITEALRESISMFEKELPGFISEEALLHGVETRTSSPVRIPRSNETYESTSLKGLYPVGEGAGYAGGIVSAAVDGMFSGFAVAKSFDLFDGTIESVIGKAQGAGLVKY